MKTTAKTTVGMLMDALKSVPQDTPVIVCAGYGAGAYCAYITRMGVESGMMADPVTTFWIQGEEIL